MGALKTLFLPLAVSVGLHATLGWTLARHWGDAQPHRADSVQISYPETPSVRASADAPPLPPNNNKKKLRGIPIPRYTAQPVAHRMEQKSDFQSKMDSELKKQKTLLSKLNAPATIPLAPGPAPIKKTRPRTGAEIMADPQKGKVFIGYFSEVKKKIQKTLVDRFSSRYSGKGSVALAFVLSSQGFVEKVSVLPKGTEGDTGLHELAVQCLNESAPFGAFPPGLGPDRIAFNVTIFFDGR